jgi:hypothetical protein
MTQWKDTRPACLAVLAASLIGATPPVAGQEFDPRGYAPPPFESPLPVGSSEPIVLDGPITNALLLNAAVEASQVSADPGPSPLLEPKTLHDWGSAPVPLSPPQTQMSNHVFAVPQEEGRVLAGSDPNFLIYPPDVSVECEHRGPCLPHGDNWTQIVHVYLFAANQEELLFGLGVGSDAGFTQSRPERSVIPKGEFWDVIAPDNVVSILNPTSPTPQGVAFIYTGEVGPGLKLASPQPALEPALPAPPHASWDGGAFSLLTAPTLDVAFSIVGEPASSCGSGFIR